MNNYKDIRGVSLTAYQSEVVYWLYVNQHQLKKHSGFDYPEYGGMPRSMADQLPAGFVDAIQDCWIQLTARPVKAPHDIACWLDIRYLE